MRSVQGRPRKEACRVEETDCVFGRSHRLNLSEIRADQRVRAVSEAFLDGDLDLSIAPRPHATVGAKRLPNAWREAECAGGVPWLRQFTIVECVDRDDQPGLCLRS